MTRAACRKEDLATLPEQLNSARSTEERIKCVGALTPAAAVCVGMATLRGHEGREIFSTTDRIELLLPCTLLMASYILRSIRHKPYGILHLPHPRRLLDNVQVEVGEGWLQQMRLITAEPERAARLLAAGQAAARAAPSSSSGAALLEAPQAAAARRVCVDGSLHLDAPLRWLAAVALGKSAHSAQSKGRRVCACSMISCALLTHMKTHSAQLLLTPAAVAPPWPSSQRPPRSAPQHSCRQSRCPHSSSSRPLPLPPCRCRQTRMLTATWPSAMRPQRQ